jgi:tetratricopeptide (TPR) repeat protein
LAKVSLLLGRIYVKQEKYKEAEDAFKYALRLEENCLGPMYLKDDIIQEYANLLKRLHRDNDATRLTRNDDESYFSIYEQVNTANHFLDLGKVKEANSMLIDAAKFIKENNLLNKDTVSGMNALAESYYRLQNYSESSKATAIALQMLQKLRLQDPIEYKRVYLIGGQTLMEQGQLEKANQYLLQSLALCRGAPELTRWPTEGGKTLAALGELQLKEHNYKAASEYFNKALPILARDFHTAELAAQVRKDLSKCR